MLNQFSRTELLLGKEALDKLAAAELLSLESVVLVDMYAKP